MKKAIVFIIVVCSLLLNSCSEDAINVNGVGNITGKVVLHGSNSPVENAKVSTNPTSSTVFTNANGEFIIPNVGVGDYSVEASKDELLTSFEGVTVVTNSTVSTVFEMQVNTFTNALPSQPILLAPDDNQEDLDVIVDLSWEATDIDEDELEYKIEIRNDQNADILVFENILESTLQVTGLNYGTRYFWQVSVTDNINTEVWSNTWSFKTSIDPEHRFLFTRKINGNEVIFSSEAGGVGDDIELLQLTSSEDNCWRPRKSLASGLIAFLKNNGANTHLYTMTPDGENITQVTNAVPIAGFNLGELDFCWSSNGETLLYTAFDKLFSINKDGSALTLVHQTLDGSLITECDWTVDGNLVALKTNALNGYGVSIYTIDMSGTVMNNILFGVAGAAGGINFSVDNTKLLYTHDISGFESSDYRQLDTHIFIYDFITLLATDLSANKPVGFIDLDPRFSPNEAEVIFTETSNDGVSERVVTKLEIASTGVRTVLFNDAKMPDWE